MRPTPRPDDSWLHDSRCEDLLNASDAVQTSFIVSADTKPSYTERADHCTGQACLAQLHLPAFGGPSSPPKASIKASFVMQLVPEIDVFGQFLRIRPAAAETA